MNGSELMAARRYLGWTRQELADKAGLTVHRVATIEQGKRHPSTDELQALRKLLIGETLAAVVDSGQHPIVEVEGAEAQSAVWNGLRRGDEVKLVGEKGRFRFLFHYRDDTQEYVEVFGPIPGSVPRSRNPKAAHQRSVRPDRVVTL